MNDEFLARLSARRHVSLRRLVEPGPDAAGLQQLLEAAAQAPDHGSLRPWRFILVPTHRRQDLGEVFADALMQHTPDCGEAARAAAVEKAFNAPCLLVAVVGHDPAASSVGRDDKLVSLGCAIQNMLLAAHALQFASGLASSAALASPGMRQLLRLEAHEDAVCFVGFGTAGSAKPGRQRPQPADFFSSL